MDENKESGYFDDSKDYSDDVYINTSNMEKCILYPLFLLIKVSTFVFVYIGMLVMVIAVVPVILNLLLSIITKSMIIKLQWYRYISHVLVVVIWFPIFSLFISIIVNLISTVFAHFFADAASSVLKFTSVLERFNNTKYNHKWMIAQLVLYVAFDLLCIALLLVGFFSESAINLGLGLTFISNVIFALWGILKIFYLSWSIVIFPIRDSVEDVYLTKEIKIDPQDTPSKEDGPECRALILFDENDPAKLRYMEDWVKLLKNPNITHYKSFDTTSIVTGSIFGVLNVVQIIFSFISAYSEYKENKGIVGFVLPILSVVAFPFCTLINITIPFRHTCCSSTGENDLGNLKMILLGFAILLISAIPILIIAFFIFGRINEKSFALPEIKRDYEVKGKYERRYTSKNFPSYCDAHLGFVKGIYLYPEDVSVLMTIGEYIQENADYEKWNCTYGEYRSSVRSILEYVFNESFPYITLDHICFDNHLLTSTLIVKTISNNDSSIYSIGRGFKGMMSIAAYLEVFVQQYFPTIITYIIPCASMIINTFSGAFSSIQIYSQMAMGILPIVNTVSRKAVKLLDEVTRNSSSTSLFGVGQSIGGYLIKLISSAKDISGIAYDSPPLFPTYKKLYNKNMVDTEDSTVSTNLLNFNFEGSLLGGTDNEIKQNIIAPNYFGKKPMNSFDTACMVVAVCDIRNRYAAFCEQVYLNDKDKNKYAEMVKAADKSVSNKKE